MMLRAVRSTKWGVSMMNFGVHKVISQLQTCLLVTGGLVETSESLHSMTAATDDACWKHFWFRNHRKMSESNRTDYGADSQDCVELDLVVQAYSSCVPKNIRLVVVYGFVGTVQNTAASQRTLGVM